MFVVTQAVTASGRRGAIWTSAGVGVGILLHATFALTGLSLILQQSDGIRTFIQILGSAYLIYLAVLCFRAAKSASDNAHVEESTSVAGKMFLRGLAVNVLNVKAMLFFLALFSGIIAEDTPFGQKAFYGLYLGLATFAWFSLFAIVLSREGVMQVYLKKVRIINSAQGVILLVMGALWMLDGLRVLL